MKTELFIYIIQFFIIIGIFAALVVIGKFISNKFNSIPRLKKSKFTNPLEYFPSEGILTLKQVFYLIMILIFIMTILYLLFDWVEGAYFIFTFDIIISVYLTININGDSFKDKALLFLLIPFGSITGIVFGDSAFVLLDIFHIIGYLYFIKVYYRKFVEYTENNGLGITILFLFSIILVSFLFTILVEGVSPIDSLTTVSNAFTSNSFDASGNMMIGKLNSLLLAWSGFILSLTVSIVMRYVSREFDDIKDLIRKKKKDN